jgi:hypothetical protein
MKTPKNGKISWQVNCSGTARKGQRKAARAAKRVKDDLGFYRVYVVIDLTGIECQVSGRVTASIQGSPGQTRTGISELSRQALCPFELRGRSYFTLFWKVKNGR